MPNDSRPILEMNLLRTKLHPPAVPVDLIHRPEQLELLNEGQSRPLILVSAPAGYGKSTLISEWLGQHTWPSCWLSLSVDESDLRRFLAYMVSAVQQIFPASLERTSEFVQAEDLPGASVLSSTLTNELDEIDHPFLLVLDDFQSIDAASPVNNFLNSLLAHPPIPFHLVIVTRRDPAISLDRLRAKGQVLELGLQELSFDLDKTKQLVRHATESSISQAAFANLDREVEGWVTGLKLAVMGLHLIPNPDQFLKTFKGGTRQLQDFLYQEVLAGLPQSMQHCLLCVSQLDRFCAPLCKAIYNPENLDSGTGEKFLEMLHTNNVFLISLDKKGTWFRFHHLFREFLQSKLAKVEGDEQIAALNSRASGWFESHGFVEEAIVYALKAGEPDKAADIIANHRQGQINTDNWHVMDRWLSMLPDASKQRPEFLLARAWVTLFRFHLSELQAIVYQLKELELTQPIPEAQLSELRFFEGELLFWAGEGAEAHALFAQAREHLSVNAQLGVLENVDAACMLIQGKSADAYDQIQIAENRGDQGQLKYHYRVFHAHCVISLLAGNLGRARREAEAVENYFESQKMKYGRTWSGYILACAELQTGHFNEAIRVYERIKGDKYIMHRRLAFDAIAGLALSLQLSGNETAATQAVADLKEFALEVSDLNGTEIADSCAARVLLLQGNVNLAAVWAGFSNEPADFQDYFLWQEIPKITRARLWVAYGSTESLERAIEYLDQELVRVTGWHLEGQKIEILALKSLALAGLGRTQDALTCLNDTVQLAAKGRWLRPFLEPGEVMLDLLEQLDRSDLSNDSVRQLLEQLRTHRERLEHARGQKAASSGAPCQSFGDDLTRREQEILELVAQRYQNKEIALHLSVSPETVKSHLKHLFSKLDVSNRREAAARFQDITATS